MAVAKKPSPKKPAPKKSPVKKAEKPVVAEQPTQLSPLQRQAVQSQLDGLRQGFRAAVGAPAEKPAQPALAVEYKVTFSDGSVLLARGEHADVILRFNDECQSLCLSQGMAVYNGPPMKRLTAEQYAADPDQRTY